MPLTCFLEATREKVASKQEQFVWQVLWFLLVDTDLAWDGGSPWKTGDFRPFSAGLISMDPPQN